MATDNKAEHKLDTSFPRVERTENALKSSGFRDIAVSASSPRSEETIEPAVAGETMVSLVAATGAASGAVIGGALGWLAGISSLSIPDVGPLTWTGPITAAFAGFAAGALIGGLGGALIGRYIPDLEASRYAGSIKEGGIFLPEQADESHWSEKAMDRVMEMHLNGRETSEERGKTRWGQGSVERRKTVRTWRTAKDSLMEGV